jgi:uncharacterized membrane protein YvbJ
MKSCFHCGETLSSVAPRCTKCGVWIDETVAPVSKTTDLPLGLAMTPLMKASVIVFSMIVLTVVVLMMW